MEETCNNRVPWQRPPVGVSHVAEKFQVYLLVFIALFARCNYQDANLSSHRLFQQYFVGENGETPANAMAMLGAPPPSTTEDITWRELVKLGKHERMIG